MALKPPLSPRYFAQKRVTHTILRGSLIVAILLTVILGLHDLHHYGGVRARCFIALGVIAYLCIGEVLMRTRYAFWANWLIIALYGAIAYVTLLIWGLNAPVGILATGFVVILPGLLIGSRHIFPVTIATIGMLLAVQSLHAGGVVTPDIQALKQHPSFWDFAVYATILIIFALVSWVSRHQIEASLYKARQAEGLVKAQKETLRIELEKESARLRQLQLQETQQLHKFAVLGQSTAATLHELSNHLSVLNMDLDDIRQQSRNTEAIKNAHESIQSINRMVLAARRQLNTYDGTSSFQALSAIKRALRDLADKFSRKQVSLKTDLAKLKASFLIKGDATALMQVITILATNALDACHDFDSPEVTIVTTASKGFLIISVADTGMGISEEAQKTLFQPVKSSKTGGLGVGLYIARTITESHFVGTISFENLEKGARFTITLPYITRRKGTHHG